MAGPGHSFQKRDFHMTFSQQPSRFAMLSELAQETSSEGRRELLRKVTEAMDPGHSGAGELQQFDQLLATVAADYSVDVRAQISRLVAHGGALRQSAQHFALDDIEVARHVLENSTVLTEATLLKVIDQKSSDHLMAVTKRQAISPVISHALVERGNDEVVSSLLKNRSAEIAPMTFDAVARRAETSAVLHGPLIHRADVPVELLNGLYMKVEADLRKEIIAKFDTVPPEELEKAFQRSRDRMAGAFGGTPEDFAPSNQRIDEMAGKGGLRPPALVTLLREGKPSRTAFKIALARLCDVDFDLINRVVETFDLDTVALLCRGAGFDRALFVSLAVGLDHPDRALAGAEQFGKLYESVPVQAAQRAIRFWKVRAAA